MRVGEPCPVCGAKAPSGVSSRQKTCSWDCGRIYHDRQNEARRVARRQSVGSSAPTPTLCHPESLSVAPEPVAELTRPSPWTAPVSPVPQPVEQARPAGRTRRILIWPDTHLPYADPRAVSLALNITAFYRPEILVLLGDVIDCTGFSRFARNTTDPKTYLATELEEWHSLARSLRDAAPDAERIYIRGNHEARIEKWLWGQPQLTGYGGFNLGSLLTLADHGFRPEVVEEIEFCQGALTIRHGSFIGGNFAGTAARQEMMRAGTSGVSGHTHRAAKYIQRDKAGLRMWIEGGHLALNPQHYSPQVQNWCQAVTLGEIEVDGNGFDLDVVPFRLSYKARVMGRELAA